MRFVLVMLALVFGGASVRAEGPVVAAASDLKFALDELAAQFTAEGGGTVRLVFGSSGNFARQIAQGGPFELFLSADEDYVRALEDKGLTEGSGALYAVGRVVLFVPRGRPFRADPEAFRDALMAGQVRRFALANPEHAPYGRAARQVLESWGVWPAVEKVAVYGENASQAAQFAASGSADGGIIPYSLALAPAVSAAGEWALLPEQAHRPLRQRMVLLKGAGATARAFYAYLQRPAARAVLARYGFATPE